MENIILKNKQELRIFNFLDETYYSLGILSYEYLRHEALVIKSQDKFIKQKIQKLLDEFLISNVIHKVFNLLFVRQKKNVEIIVN